MKFNIVALFAYHCLAAAAAAAAAAAGGPGQPGSAGIQLHVEFPLEGAGWPDDYDKPSLAPKKKKKPGKPAWTPVETEDVPSPQVPECGVDCLLQYHAILGCEFVDDWACLCRGGQFDLRIQACYRSLCHQRRDFRAMKRINQQTCSVFMPPEEEYEDVDWWE